MFVVGQPRLPELAYSQGYGSGRCPQSLDSVSPPKRVTPCLNYENIFGRRFSWRSVVYRSIADPLSPNYNDHELVRLLTNRGATRASDPDPLPKTPPQKPPPRLRLREGGGGKGGIFTPKLELRATRASGSVPCGQDWFRRFGLAQRR